MLDTLLGCCPLGDLDARWLRRCRGVGGEGGRAIVILTPGTRLQTTNDYTSARLLAIAMSQRRC